HLDFPQFDADRAEVLDRARQAGVRAVLAIGSGPGPEKLDAALPFAEGHDWIYASVGIHPHEARLATEAHFEELEHLVKHPRVIAWGEEGNRDGFPGFLRRQPDLPKGAELARHRAGVAAGPPADRDRRAVSGATGPPRQAKRAGLCR